jgi:tetratricopeptide (TPR) repeat protein
VAARLEQAAPVNEVLIGDLTYALVRSQVVVEAVEPLMLKGKSEPVPAYRLVGLAARGRGGASRTPDLPLVGREAQLRALHDGLATVAREGGCRLLTVTGEGGVGKKHLIDVFERDLAGSATVLRGRCLPYGDGITFWPLIELARSAAGIVDDDSPEQARAKLAEAIAGAPAGDETVERMASIMGLGPGSFPLQELFWGARRYLEALAGRRPLVVVIEDGHHAQTTFLDLLDEVLASTAPHASLLLIVTARPLLLDARPTWGEAERTGLVELRPLDPDDTGRLVEALLGGPVAAPVKQRIASAAEGNPLFVAQLVSLFVDNGLVQRHGDAWEATGDLEAAKVPPTLQAVLAARLDDLSPEERAVLEPAAVIGLSFPESAVEELVPPEIRPGVAQALGALDRKQFIDQVDGKTGEDRVFRFRNQLIRDATYGSLLKRSRAQLHERFVTWAERVNRERGREEEFEEINGYHLEQAYRYRTELGPLDAHGRELAARAAVKLGNAGRRAFARSDIPATIGLLRRAATLYETEMPGRVELLGELGEALVVQGSFDQAASVLDDAAGDAQSIGDPCLVARVRVTRLMLRLYVKEDEETATASIAAAEDLIRILEPYDDDEGLARAWRIVMANQFTLGNLDQAGRAAEHVVEHALRAGDVRLASRSAPAVAYVMVHGPTPVDEAIRQCEELFDGLRGDRRNEAIVLAALAQLKAMQGAFDEARALYRSGKSILEELDTGLTARNTSIDSHRVELLAGDPAAADAELRRDDAALAALGESYFRSTVTAVLANVLAARGELDEALGYSEVAERLADEDDAWSQAAWRTARAQVLAARGDPATAGRLADEAARLVRSSDDLLVRVDTLETVASVLDRIGRSEEAEATLAEALALHEAKMDAVSARRVAERLASLRIGQA